MNGLTQRASGMTANSIALLPISLLPLGEGLGMRACYEDQFLNGMSEMISLAERNHLANAMGKKG